ncbi:MAG: methanogenesis marker 12 protein, partial [Methanoregula sp.]|nr:methanogenesis marker 12 protein [Methanoregula sp.]
MFIGIDHGTMAMRFAGGKGEFRILRETAKEFRIAHLSRLCPLEEIEGIAICYSMGDNLAAITDIRKVKNRGIVSRDGAGKHIGGGTRVYDEVAASGIPAVVMPGIHRGSPTDPRFKAYSHQTSPEKIGIAYEVCTALGDDVIVSDVSSNTVSLLVSGGRLVGAFDACIFAPGTLHGALDVDAIRKVDAGTWTANEAFQHAGVDFSLPEGERMRAVAMFAAMECSALRLLNRKAGVALAGSLAPVIAGE